jgi:RNA polymerase sigma-70 factor (ECF subfamily)
VTGSVADLQAKQFEEHRGHLRSVAYRMLGSLSDADDAVQEAWLRLDRSDTTEVENLRGWLTTVVARVSLNMLRARRARHEDYAGTWLPEPIVRIDTDGDPEDEALLADSIGIAMLVVLETLTPAERLAFVLHDMFGMPFEEIAPVVGRSPAAARQLASRGRRRVRGAIPKTDPDLAEQRRVVDAFLAASRAGDFEALLEVLDPDVVFRADNRRPVAGAADVARRVLARGTRLAPFGRPAIVNGAAGVVVVVHDRPVAIVGFTVAGGRVVELDLITDRNQLERVAGALGER